MQMFLFGAPRVHRSGRVHREWHCALAHARREPYADCGAERVHNARKAGFDHPSTANRLAAIQPPLAPLQSWTARR